MTIDTCVENVSGADLKALAASTPKCRQRENPRPTIPASIQDELNQKGLLRGHVQVTRYPDLRADFKRLKNSLNRRVKEWRKDQCSATFESLHAEDQSLWKMTKRVMRFPTPFTPGHPNGNRSLRLWDLPQGVVHSTARISKRFSASTIFF